MLINLLKATQETVEPKFNPGSLNTEHMLLKIFLAVLGLSRFKWAFSSWRSGLLFSFLCCGAQALGMWASAAGCVGSAVLSHRLSTHGTQA